MMGSTHRWFGALAGATVATLEGADTTIEVIMAGLIASAVSNGEFSPDMDQTKWWNAILFPKIKVKFLRLKIPLPSLGKTGIGKHRYGLSHWFVLPFLAWGLIVATAPEHTHWAGLALVAGWASHLVGDLIFGKLALSPTGHGPKFGIGLKTDGFLEAGKLHFRLPWQRERQEHTVIPFGPTKVAIVAALAWVLFSSPDLAGMDFPDVRDAVDKGIAWVLAQESAAATP